MNGGIEETVDSFQLLFSIIESAGVLNTDVVDDNDGKDDVTSLLCIFDRTICWRGKMERKKKRAKKEKFGKEVVTSSRRSSITRKRHRRRQRRRIDGEMYSAGAKMTEEEAAQSVKSELIAIAIPKSAFENRWNLVTNN